MRTKIGIAVIAILVVILNSCEKNKAVPIPLSTGCNLTGITYTNTIQPIISFSCAYSLRCHAAGSIYPDFSSYEGVKTYADNGQLYEQLFVTYKMPPAPQPLLDVCETNQIKVWIDNGAPQ